MGWWPRHFYQKILIERVRIDNIGWGSWKKCCWFSCLWISEVIEIGISVIHAWIWLAQIRRNSFNCFWNRIKKVFASSKSYCFHRLLITSLIIQSRIGNSIESNSTKILNSKPEIRRILIQNIKVNDRKRELEESIIKNVSSKINNICCKLCPLIISNINNFAIREWKFSDVARSNWSIFHKSRIINRVIKDKEIFDNWNNCGQFIWKCQTYILLM